MDNLSVIPVDHQKLIYQNLDIKDLLNLRMVCKIFKNDSYIWHLLITKIVESHFSEIDENLDKYIDLIFRMGNPSELVHLYHHRLIGLEFSETFSKDPNQQRIYIDSRYFSLLSIERKIEWIEHLGKNLFLLWQYAEKNNQDIYFENENIDSKDPLSFDYYILNLCFENILKTMFRVESNTIRQLILNKIKELEIQTKDSKEGLIRFNSEYYIYFRNTNQFHSLYFIATIDPYLFYELDDILSVAEFLLEQIGEYDRVYLFQYLRDKMDPFFDYENQSLDVYVKPLIEKLNKIYSENKTYKQRLFELFTICNYNIHEQFDSTLYWREKRIEDSIYDGYDEDFDF